MRVRAQLAAIPFCVLCLGGTGWAQDSAARPVVWMAPPGTETGRSWRALFAQPEQWKETRSLVDGLLCADHNLNRSFTDDELRGFFDALGMWGLRFQLEVGAVKDWGPTGAKAFEQDRRMWERFSRLGAKIDSIAMDEPLVCVRQHLKKPDDYAVEETASFVALVRRHFPQVRIGDIETYPSTPIEDHFRWIEALQKRLAEKQVRGLDFYRLDVDWVNFTLHGRGSWREVHRLEAYCRQHKLPFSLIYWASGYPGLQRRGLADDSTWYTSILRQGADYAMADGAPEEYVIESWVGAPSNCVPETADFTFTRSVRDFVRLYVRRPRGPP